VAADSGDYWADLILGTSTFNPLLLGSGAQGTITLTITPDSTQVGQTISGYVYVDTINPTVGTGDESCAFLTPTRRAVTQRSLGEKRYSLIRGSSQRFLRCQSPAASNGAIIGCALAHGRECDPPPSPPA